MNKPRRVALGTVRRGSEKPLLSLAESILLYSYDLPLFSKSCKKRYCLKSGEPGRATSLFKLQDSLSSKWEVSFLAQPHPT